MNGFADLPPEQEADNLLGFYGDPVRAMDVVSHHLTVLHGRAQVLVTLAGLAITVCGFSGARIAASGLVPQVLLISGLAIVLCSAYRVFLRVMRIRWLTHFMGNPPREALIGALTERNQRLREYGRCCHLFFVGAILYTAAIGHMLVFTSAKATPGL